MVPVLSLKPQDQLVDLLSRLTLHREPPNEVIKDQLSSLSKFSLRSRDTSRNKFMDVVWRIR